MPAPIRIRHATVADAKQLLHLWTMVYSGDDSTSQAWGQHAEEWFAQVVEDRAKAHFPVIIVDSNVVATAIGTLELGVPNPCSVTGRSVRLANVVTMPEHRRRGYGTLLVRSVVEWAREIAADRVDLSATPDGQRIYEKAGFEMTNAPRMKLSLR